MPNDAHIYSGASPQEVVADLQPLVDFRESGLPLEQLEQLVNERLLPHLLHYDRPEFQSMFNAYPETGAEWGGRVALSTNQGVTNWQVSPGGATLEELCCQALCRLFELPPTADATFMYSGTYANQQALYLALHRYCERQGVDLAEEGLAALPDPGRLAVLTSYDAHFSVKHAVRMLGLGEQSLVLVPVDATYRIDLKQLESILESLRPEREPFCLIVTAGTTSTGAVDRLRPIAELGQKHQLWLHVDGAYGLAYRLVPRWKPLFDGVELADSISWDPHKQMGVPIPNSVLFVRDRTDFGRMALHAHYFNREGDVEPNPGLKSPPSTRPLAALSLVASLRHQGLAGVRQRLAAPLQAIRGLTQYLHEEPDVVSQHWPDTGILCFRIEPENFPAEELDQLQEYVYRQIMAAGQRSISITQLSGKRVLRVVAISPAVTAQALIETVQDIRRVAARYPS